MNKNLMVKPRTKKVNMTLLRYNHNSRRNIGVYTIVEWGAVACVLIGHDRPGH